MGRNKRAQVTIFIIAGIALIAIILLLLLLKGGKNPDTGGSGEGNSNSFLQTCLEDSITEAVGVIGENGGYITPEFPLNIKLVGESVPRNISYLCYTSLYNAPCTIQEPMLFKHIEKEVKEYIKHDVDNCFSGTSGLTASLSDKGHVVAVRYKPGDFDLSIKRNQISVKINGELTLTKGDQTKKEKDFKVSVNSGLYDMLMYPIQEILNRKSSSLTCFFDDSAHGLLYSEFIVYPTILGNGTEIYGVEHKKSREKFIFAVRSCVERGGYGAGNGN